MTVALVVRRAIRATPERLFEAWTTPAQLVAWWGPRNAVCTAAELDLRPGGRYRIANKFADGRVVWIGGEFELIDRPHALGYTWGIEPAAPHERVTVRFEPRGGATEVVVVHERVAGEEARRSHEEGWDACLDGLARYLA